jgi:N-carbamoylputrescine amidase
MKVALIQQKYLSSSKETISQSLKMISEASKNGAKLVVLPELHQNEYFPQSYDEKYFEYADNYNNDLLFWAKVAKEYNVVLITSLFEKALDGLYFNTSVVFDSDGSIAGKYRKMHIPDDPNFYEKYYFSTGDMGFEPIKTSVGNLGVMICWDQWFGEGARIMALKGADILIYPTAIGWLKSELNDKSKAGKKELKSQRKSWLTIQKSHAISNSLPVIAVNRVGYEQDITNKNQGIEFWGSSFVTDTRGNIISKANKTDETILYSDIDMKKRKETRQGWPFLRDRRVEYYYELTKKEYKK